VIKNTHVSIVSIKEKIYLVIFLVMSIVYAFFSSPSPNQIGLYEILIALCLTAIVGFKGVFFTLGYQAETSRNIHVLAIISFLFLVVVPTITGLIVLENEISNYIRDIVPMLYLILPIFIFHRVKINPSEWMRGVVFSICVIGLAYSIRQIIESNILISHIGSKAGFITQNYFILDPAVFFTATFLTCYSAVLFLQSYFLKGLSLAVLAMVPWFIILAAVSRSAIALVLIALLAIIFLTIARSKTTKLSSFKTMIPVVAILVFMSPELVTLFSKIWIILLEKYENVGLNGRLFEIQYVVENIDNIRTLLFGEGWGGLIDSPLFSDSVRFTHNSFSYFLFKSGVIGLMAFIVYLYFLFSKMFSGDVLNKKSAIILPVQAAIIVTSIIHFLLAAGFKSLTIGMVLTLIMLLGMKNNRNSTKSSLIRD